jgi:hypothetical protein
MEDRQEAVAMDGEEEGMLRWKPEMLFVKPVGRQFEPDQQNLPATGMGGG